MCCTGRLLGKWCRQRPSVRKPSSACGEDYHALSRFALPSTPAPTSVLYAFCTPPDADTSSCYRAQRANGAVLMHACASLPLHNRCKSKHAPCLSCRLPLPEVVDCNGLVCLLPEPRSPLSQSTHCNLSSDDRCTSSHVALCKSSGYHTFSSDNAGHHRCTPLALPTAHKGTNQVFPAKGPAGTACVESSTRTVATISLSATGSRKAPKADTTFCDSGATQGYHGDQPPPPPPPHTHTHTFTNKHTHTHTHTHTVLQPFKECSGHNDVFNSLSGLCVHFLSHLPPLPCVHCTAAKPLRDGVHTIFRARYPSSQSVSAAAMNSPVQTTADQGDDQ